MRAHTRTGQGDAASSPGSISRADVAAVCVEALANPAARNVTVEVSGAALGEGQDYGAVLKGMWAALKPDAQGQAAAGK